MPPPLLLPAVPPPLPPTPHPPTHPPTPPPPPTHPPTPTPYLQYHNIFRMVRELGVPWPFTDFETSGFWGRGGRLITQAPVFSKQPRLPAVLGQFVHTANLFGQ